MVIISKSDALNIYKYLYHYQDLIREQITVDDGDELSQIHRRLHYLIVESYPDLRDPEDNRDYVDAKILLSLPPVVVKTPAGSSSTFKFDTRSDELVAVVVEDGLDEVIIDNLKSFMLNGKVLTLKDDDDDVHDFTMTKANRRWNSALGRGIEKFLDDSQEDDA